jgi:DNA-binding MarR family transcriptional regulator
MSAKTSPPWAVLTNHAQVLLCMTHEPDIRLRDIAERVKITERAVHRIVSDLANAGHITRTRVGRRNVYTVIPHHRASDPTGREVSPTDA